MKTRRKSSARLGHLLAVLLGLALVQPALADKSRKSADEPASGVDASVDTALADIVDATAERARRVVRENTGIDLSRRGYTDGGRGLELPSDAGDDAQRELTQLSEQHDHKIRKLEESLDKKLSKAREKLQRDVSKRDDPDAAREKHARLRSKVDEAYAKFDQQVAHENQRFDDKRRRIIDRHAQRDGARDDEHRRPDHDKKSRD